MSKNRKETYFLRLGFCFPGLFVVQRTAGEPARFSHAPKQCDRRRQGERKKDEKGRKETAGRGIDAAERANLRENLCTDIIFYITAHAA